MSSAECSSSQHLAGGSRAILRFSRPGGVVTRKQQDARTVISNAIENSTVVLATQAPAGLGDVEGACFRVAGVTPAVLEFVASLVMIGAPQGVALSTPP